MAARNRMFVLIAGAMIAAMALGAVAQDKAATPAAAPPATAAPVAAAPARPAQKIDTLRRIHDTGALLVGVRETSVPFSFLDAQKQPQGYSIDLCLRVADAIKSELKMTKLDVKFVPVSSSNRIPALLEGKIDLECGSTTNTRAARRRSRSPIRPSWRASRCSPRSRRT